MIRRAISPRLAMRSVVISVICNSHSKHSIAGRTLYRGGMGNRKSDTQHRSGIAGIDNAIIPYVSGGVEGVGLAINLFLNRPTHHCVCHFIVRLTRMGRSSTTHNGHNSPKLFATHNGNAMIGPGKNEARIERAPRHTIVTSAITGPNHQRDMWDCRVGDSVNKLGSILNNAAFLIKRADHEAGNVLQKENGDGAGIAQLDKVCPLLCLLGKENTIVSEHANRKAMDGTPPGHECRPEERFELIEVRVIQDTSQN